ncbi:hypothetical protein DMC18_01255 [Caulobacter sp. D5]|uniref:acetyltransferase n=1 Tax=Caulobacter sp. D5 TaxID=357400 RepID=UPI000D72824B|nr:acetyltransferase [Caulobacter sp. D5]PXA96510.1 hypothetical protein DMC18_01255 [Caulobacter sp. D5]
MPLNAAPAERGLVIVGSGGHAKVIIEIARAEGRFDLVGCTDSHSTAPDVLGVPMLGDDSMLPGLLANGTRHAFVALGANALRLRLGRALLAQGFEMPSLIHPSAIISPSARIGRGVAVMAGAVINASAEIGDFCIVNTLASIDHDCVLEDGVHVAPRTALAGCVHLEEAVFLGAGAVAIPGIRVGTRTVIGAGGVVVSDLPPNAVAVGVPARPKIL